MPNAKVRGEGEPRKLSDANTSDSAMPSRSGLGTSTPMQVLPGTVSTIRIDCMRMPRARSFWIFMIEEPRTPSPGSTSKRVMTGPVTAPVTKPGARYSASLPSMTRDRASTSRRLALGLRSKGG